MAHLFKQSLQVTGNHFRLWKKDSRIWVTAIILLIILGQYFYGITIFGLTYKTKTTPFLLSLIYTDGTISNGLLKILVYLGIICIFCDAPFFSERTKYEIVRCGKKVWFAGGRIYIWIVSFGYLLFLTAGAFLIVAPTVSCSDLWGSSMREFARYTQRSLACLTLSIPVEVIQVIYPSSAQLLTMAAAGLSNVFLGYVICFWNLLTAKNGPGITVAIFIVMLDPIVRYLGYGEQNYWMYLCSPISWSSIEGWDILGAGHPIPMWYVFLGFASLILMMEVLLRVLSSRKEFM